ncbi:MAG: MBL fold metallo-hydrolase [Candidatus Cloacimonetes bacterium]|jgi:glyoxylase-like metal-dependent hydrolase (beta-lactamase superfamily II)|nr:MBL fold metallo-hydrolase [Candidatus Cloacimonadota bacterium]MDD4155622.1 MBL fold metallo-hydrolase [Candidatus Cloacimonadota bacterium]
MIKYKIYNLIEMFETNTYLVWDTESLDAILIDPAAPSENLKSDIINLNLNLIHIFNTHGHGDHIGGNEYFHQAFNCPIGIHNFDAEMLLNSTMNLSDFMYSPIISPAASLLLKDFYDFSLGENKVEMFHTPGHTKGGIVIYIKPYLFSGDTIFNLSVGRTDLPGGNSKELIESIRKKVFSLPDDTIILPGHGPASTIAKEKKENPFV